MAIVLRAGLAGESGIHLSHQLLLTYGWRRPPRPAPHAHGWPGGRHFGVHHQQARGGRKETRDRPLAALQPREMPEGRLGLSSHSLRCGASGSCTTSAATAIRIRATPRGVRADLRKALRSALRASGQTLAHGYRQPRTFEPPPQSSRSAPLVLRFGTDPTAIRPTTVIVLISTTTVSSSPALAT
jgi:hypothetical protein